VQLSRALAERGHRVTHSHFSEFESTKGPLEPRSRARGLRASRDRLRPLAPGRLLPRRHRRAGTPLALEGLGADWLARIVERGESGLVCEAGDEAKFLDAAARLLGDPVAHERFGSNARAYAERHFHIDTITDRFEAILQDAIQGVARRGRT
jgi:glycosyltransferase involved in cell wall biosynthesis